MSSFLNKTQIVLDDKISVKIPTLREIKGSDMDTGLNVDEDNYYSILNLFLTTPVNCIASLEQLGIDFTEISDYKLFLILYNVSDKEVIRKVSPLMFKNFNFADFEICQKQDCNEITLYNQKDDVEINEYKYKWLSNVFCTMHLYTKDRKINPGNNITKKYIIERAITKSKWKKNKSSSNIDNLILAMVNNCNFKYNFETVYDLTVYDFNASVRQILKKYQVDNLYHGIYSGCVDSSKLKKDSLDWLSFEYTTTSKKIN